VAIVIDATNLDNQISPRTRAPHERKFTDPEWWTNV
jgi:hypothetical protein